MRAPPHGSSAGQLRLRIRCPAPVQHGEQPCHRSATVSGNLLTADVGHQNGPFLGFEADTEHDDGLRTLGTSRRSCSKRTTTVISSTRPDGAGVDQHGAHGRGYRGLLGMYPVPSGSASARAWSQRRGGDRRRRDDHGRGRVQRGRCADGVHDFLEPGMHGQSAHVVERCWRRGRSERRNGSVFSADATMGTASVTGLGPHYFCVLTENADWQDERSCHPDCTW